MEESVSVFLSSKIDACQQPSAPNIQICSEPFIPFFCCFYSIICSEKLEDRVTLKFSMTIISAIDCHRLTILCHYHPHSPHTKVILEEILLTWLRESDVLLPTFLHLSFHCAIRQCNAFNMHYPDLPCPGCATVFSTSLRSAIHISVLGYIVFFVSPFITKILIPRPVFLLIHFFLKVLDFCMSSYLVSIFIILIPCSVIYLLCMVYLT